MNRRILIVGVGANQVGAVTKARELGLYVVGMDGSAEAPGLRHADAAAVANILDPAAIVEVARAHGIEGIYPAAEPGVEAASQAAHELGLPGLSPEVAKRVRNKLAARQALEAAGVPVPAYRGVKSVSEAEAAARAIGLPVIAKPVDGNASKGVMRVDYEADMSLAFAQAVKLSRVGAVLVEAFMEGEEFNVDGLVHAGRYRLGGMTGKELSPPPYRYDTGIYMPPLLSDSDRQAILDMVERSLRAIGLTDGTTHVEVMLTPDGPRIVEMAGRFGGGRIPTDLIPTVYGMDYMADSIRIAMGDAPTEQLKHERGCAVYWVPSRSGVVTEIQGAEEARSMPGVMDVVMSVKPGDVLGHVVDCVTRDRIGYVMAAGDSAPEAIERAKAARDAINIVTQPIYGLA